MLQLSKFSSHVSFTSMGGCYDCRSSSSMMLFEICQIFVFTTQVLMPALTLLDSTPSKAQLCSKNLHLSWVPIVACFLNVFYHKATVLIELHASQASAFDSLRRRTISNQQFCKEHNLHIDLLRGLDRLYLYFDWLCSTWWFMILFSSGSHLVSVLFALAWARLHCSLCDGYRLFFWRIVSIASHNSTIVCFCIFRNDDHQLCCCCCVAIPDHHNNHHQQLHHWLEALPLLGIQPWWPYHPLLHRIAKLKSKLLWPFNRLWVSLSSVLRIEGTRTWDICSDFVVDSAALPCNRPHASSTTMAFLTGYFQRRYLWCADFGFKQLIVTTMAFLTGYWSSMKVLVVVADQVHGWCCTGHSFFLWL